MKTMRTALGICIGASSIKVVELSSDGATATVAGKHVFPHDCDLRGAVQRTLRQFDPARYDYVCITGRKFKDLVNLPRITEPEAVERALRPLWPQYGQRCRALMSLGSESFILYQLDEEGTIIGVRAGNKCASGTGEFFLQQIRRMDIPLEQACQLAEDVEPYAVSGRCSVFCKSDCTHALNKGIPKERVCAGLGNMIAEKALEILGALPRRNVLIVGGVTKNQYVVKQLRAQIDGLTIPPHADVFEALGAALYALEEQTRLAEPVSFAPPGSSYPSLPPLRHAAGMVTFREHPRVVAQPGDETILGLDVGSTTTKAVLLRTADDAILASVYLRTSGNPIRASRDCYAGILRQLEGVPVRIIGLGVTGSGRYIAGLHAQTDAIINEIIAHATAAAFFDPEVDTILEIGGQDAKYTYLVNGVPCDYAMNEACSAGTGSFLEEAAKESLNIDYRQIQDIAMQGDAPPNFNDQCAAFISSDIKNASHEMSRENIVAGLVYSIAMNYNNRVKGARRLGQKIFMQGGVCYNRAVPLAMAAVLGRPIIVPPEPGLMGAFGVALEVKQRLRMGLLRPSEFDLRKLADREVSYGKSFTCPGSKERCDRGCQINVIQLEGKSFPFGGICNKYYNAAHHIQIDPAPLDYVAKRQEELYRFAPPEAPPDAPTVGISRSFLTNILYPLYSHFFGALGFRVVLSDGVDPEGIRRTAAEFCYPAELAHGMMMNLVKKQPDFIFLPQVNEMYVPDLPQRYPGHQSTCVTVLAEPYYLRSAFKDLRSRLLVPALNFSAGWQSMRKQFVDLARQLGCDSAAAARAYGQAVERLEEFLRRRRELGRQALREVESSPERIGVVLFGRAYNAFAAEANMGIPRKFASRGVHIIPHDCLPLEDRPPFVGMTWASGHDLMRAAQFVKNHPQLFGVFLTNFGCGPDAFIVGYFRDIMQTKPSLTLEIDSHTADAGVTTRVEAFLDIVERYRKLGLADPPAQPFRKAQVVMRNGDLSVIASDGRQYHLRDPKVKVVFPSMGRTLSEMAAAAFQGLGVRAEAVPLPDFSTLMRGRANTCCKECLPLILTTGSMLEYVERRREPGEVLLYFMPTTNGNCRFTQYHVFLNRLIEKRRIEDLATFTLTSENSYGGLGAGCVTTLLKGIVTADVMDDIRNSLDTLAVDRQGALGVWQANWDEILRCFAAGCRDLYGLLEDVAARLAEVPLKKPLHAAMRVALAGEIFVRKDEFSSHQVVEALKRRQIVVHRAPMVEWLRYIDFWAQKIDSRGLSVLDRLKLRVRSAVFQNIERKIKRILSRSGLCEPSLAEVEPLVEVGSHFVNPKFGGETILVIGRFFTGILREFHGLISIGPFACLPTRVIQSILTPESKVSGNRAVAALPGAEAFSAFASLPFLSVECDGNPLPQVIEAELEAFCLQVERVHRKLQSNGLAEGLLRVDGRHELLPRLLRRLAARVSRTLFHI